MGFRVEGLGVQGLRSLFFGFRGFGFRVKGSPERVLKGYQAVELQYGLISLDEA